MGFNEEYIICEDGELIDRIYKHHSFCVLPQKVITSSRRFTENGVLRLQFHFMMIHILRGLGKASPLHCTKLLLPICEVTANDCFGGFILRGKKWYPKYHQNLGDQETISK